MISVVIPTKNEEATIGKLIDSVKSYCDEILVVDGHSNDATKSISIEKGARFILDDKKGKGDGLRKGIINAMGDIIVFIDADGSHDPADISKLIKPIIGNKADMVVGCRMTGGSDELHGDIGKFLRFMGSMIITLVINYRWGVRLTDVQNGFRAIKKSVALDINLLADDFTIEEEMVMKCLRKKYRVMNVPAHEYARKVGKSRIVLSRVWFGFVWVVVKNVVSLSDIKAKNRN